jgi:hypothetical protein
MWGSARLFALFCNDLNPESPTAMKADHNAGWQRHARSRAEKWIQKSYWAVDEWVGGSRPLIFLSYMDLPLPAEGSARKKQIPIQLSSTY